MLVREDKKKAASQKPERGKKGDGHQFPPELKMNRNRLAMNRNRLARRTYRRPIRFAEQLRACATERGT